MNVGRTQIVAEPMATSVTEMDHLKATLKELNDCQSEADIQGLSERVHTIMSQISGNGKEGHVLDAMKEAALALKQDGQKVKSNRMNKMRKLLLKLPGQSARKQRKMLREVLNLLGKNIGVTIGHKTGFCGARSLCCNAAIVTASVVVLAGATAMVVMGAENVFEENAMAEFQESTEAVDNMEGQEDFSAKVELEDPVSDKVEDPVLTNRVQDVDKLSENPPVSNNQLKTEILENGSDKFTIMRENIAKVWGLNASQVQNLDIDYTAVDVDSMAGIQWQEFVAWREFVTENPNIGLEDMLEDDERRIEFERLLGADMNHESFQTELNDAVNAQTERFANETYETAKNSITLRWARQVVECLVEKDNDTLMQEIQNWTFENTLDRWTEHEIEEMEEMEDAIRKGFSANLTQKREKLLTSEKFEESGRLLRKVLGRAINGKPL